LDRIVQKPTGKDKNDRSHFIHAIEELEQILRAAVKTFNELKVMRNKLKQRMSLDKPFDLLKQKDYLDYAMKEQAKESTEKRAKWISTLEASIEQ
jgi:hypothetical protein